MGIQERLRNFPVPDEVWEQYHLVATMLHNALVKADGVTFSQKHTYSIWKSDNYVYCELKEPTPEPAAQPMKKMKVVNCQSYVNLRAEATAKSESLAQLTLDTEVEATGNVSGGFIEVIYMGMRGIVAENYLAE